MTLLYSTLLFPVSRSTCFGRNPRPSSGAQFKLYSQHLGLTNGVCPAVVVDESDGGTVVKVLCYKSKGRCSDSRWCQYCTKCHLVGTTLKLKPEFYLIGKPVCYIIEQLHYWQDCVVHYKTLTKSFTRIIGTKRNGFAVRCLATFADTILYSPARQKSLLADESRTVTIHLRLNSGWAEINSRDDYCRHSQ
jgi:hypothetical protein